MTSICTCAAPNPPHSPGPGPTTAREAPRDTRPPLHPGYRAPGARRGSPPPPRRLRREEAQTPRPRPLPGRTSASCSRWSRPPAPPRSSAGLPGPTWPCLRRGAASAENKEEPRQRYGSVADVSGLRAQDQSVRSAQKVPEIPAPCATRPRPPRSPRCGAPGELERGCFRGAGARGGARRVERAGGVWAQEARPPGGGWARGGCGPGGEGSGPRRPAWGAAVGRLRARATALGGGRPGRPGGVCRGLGPRRGSRKCTGWGRPDASQRFVIITAATTFSAGKRGVE